MAISILCVGRLKEAWQRDACQEYVKRMSRYGGVEIIEVEDQKEPTKPSAALVEQVLRTEGRALLKHIRAGDRVVALCVKAEAPTSEGLAGKIAAWQMDGRRLVLVIGGSLGLSDEVLARADERVSFSNMTFPHQLMRVILLEQLYRAAKINADERYHK